MSKFFGSSQRQQTQAPTGFQTLPGFAQRGVEEAIQAGRGFLQDPSIFAPVPITAEQNQALEVLRQGAQPLTAEQFGQQRAIFEDPFTQAVLDPSLQDLERMGKSTFGDIGAQASAAGAFGGTRQAVREAELGRLLGQEAGRLSANVRSQAFQSATDRALQQLGRQQTGATQLFNVGEILRTLSQQEQQAPATAAQFLASLAQGIPAGGGPQTTTTTSGPSQAQQVGGLLQGLALLGG